jgi:hypothetical protein
MRNSAKRRLGFLIPVVAALLALSACSLVTGPEQSEDGLPDDQTNYLVTIGIIDKGEAVRFYVGGALSFEEQGSLFTDERVGAYWLPDFAHEEDRVEGILLKDVKSIKFTETDDSWAYDSYIDVTPEKGKALRVHLPGSGGFPKRFYKALKKQWEKVRA